jgi:unsaturated rhamnogalacturonyl hydrolase
MKQASSQKINTWSLRMVDSTLQRYTLSDASWNYDHGLQVMAIQKAGEATGESRYLRFVSDWIDHFVQPDGSIRTYYMDAYNVDWINSGKLLFGAYERTGDERYRKAIEHLRDQMRGHPRNTAKGFWHKQIYPYQMWLDGIYMAGPFLAEYASRFDEPETFDDVVHQITLIEKHTRDEKTGLLYHAWDESKRQRWCDPITGRSKYFWGRGIGWYVMAIVDVLDFLPREQAHRPDLIAILDQKSRTKRRDSGIKSLIFPIAQVITSRRLHRPCSFMHSPKPRAKAISRRIICCLHGGLIAACCKI